MSHDLLKVTVTIEGAHPLHTTYPLFPDDVLTKEPDGTYAKHAPGLGVFGFKLTPDQEDTLVPTTGRIVIG